jgi:hypothetical protein
MDAFKLAGYILLSAEELPDNLLQIVPPVPVGGAYALHADFTECIWSLSAINKPTDQRITNKTLPDHNRY